MKDHQSRRDTDEFPVVVPETVDNTTRLPQAGLGSGLTVEPRRENNRATALTFGVLAVLLLIIITATSFLFLGWDKGDADTAALPDPTTAEQRVEDSTEATTPTEEEATPETSTVASPAARSTAPELPAGATPVNDAALSGTPAGNLNNVYTGTASTSTEFALEVRDEFVRNYLDTGELNNRIQATSPVTGQTYEMSCSDSQGYVTCAGGNNAVIYIS